MDNVWFLLPPLACPLVMGGMMLWMMRGTHRARKPPPEDDGASD
jgi:hypothetical protein